MIEKLIELGYKIVPFLENHVIAVKDDIEIFIDMALGTYTTRNTKYNSHDKVPSDALELLRGSNYRATMVHRNMTGQE